MHAYAMMSHKRQKEGLNDEMEIDLQILALVSKQTLGFC